MRHTRWTQQRRHVPRICQDILPDNDLYKQLESIDTKVGLCLPFGSATFPILLFTALTEVPSEHPATTWYNIRMIFVNLLATSCLPRATPAIVFDLVLVCYDIPGCPQPVRIGSVSTIALIGSTSTAIFFCASSLIGDSVARRPRGCFAYHQIAKNRKLCEYRGVA